MTYNNIQYTITQINIKICQVKDAKFKSDVIYDSFPINIHNNQVHEQELNCVFHRFVGGTDGDWQWIFFK